jgi:hypothetical protein
MKNKRPPQPMEDALSQPRGANIASAESPDARELPIAELQARRVRLEKLLHSVRLEAEQQRGPRKCIIQIV